MRSRRLILALALLTAASCQAPPPASSGPPEVKGRVEDSDGNPLAHVAVKFYPRDERNKGKSVICLTQSDGSFTGRCAPGRYKVTVWGVSAMPPKAPEKGKEKAKLHVIGLHIAPPCSSGCSRAWVRVTTWQGRKAPSWWR